MDVEHIRDYKDKNIVDYTDYYSGYQLLSKKDLNNDYPEIFLIAGNRTGGKSFFFKRLLALLRVYHGHTFLWLVRKITQVKGAAESFHTDVSQCEDLQGKWELDTFVRNVTALLYEGEVVGYFTFMNFAADLKELSNMFNNVSCIIKDEFQSETNQYCEEEVQKLRSIHQSVARSFGHSNRYCATILIGNQLSIINPYYVALNIHKRLRPETHFLRGEGFVLEVFFNEKVSKRSAASAFERAFGQDEYAQANNRNMFLDNVTFIEKRDTSKMRPAFSFGKKKKWYSVWYGNSYYYVSKQPINKGAKYALDLESHSDGTILFRKTDVNFLSLKQYFDYGAFYFEDIECKSMCVDMLCYTIL